MAEEPLCRDYQWLADILTQSDTVTRATSPTTDTVDASEASADTGHKFANEVFSPGKRKTPASIIAYTDKFDTNQAVARIMKLYNLARDDYFAQAVPNNDKHRARLNYKAQYTETLIQEHNNVQAELDKVAEEMARSGAF